MKRILLIGMLGCLCLSIPVKAQLQKGTKYVAATLSLSGYRTGLDDNYFETTSYQAMSISPSMQFGKLVKDNVMAGIGIGTSLYFSWTKSKSTAPLPDYRESRGTYSLSPYIRHYKSLSPKWAVFLNSSAELVYLHSRLNAQPFDVKENGFAAGVQILPGISYWVSPRFAVESDINFLSLSTGYRSFQDNNSVYFNSAITSNLTTYFSLRASWYLQKP